MNTNNKWNEFIIKYKSPKTNKELTTPIEATLANGAKIILRLEQPEDYHEVELLIRAAFWKAENKKKLNGIGCDEHYLTHTLRTAPEFIQELDFVAVHGNKIVGNVMYSVAYVQKPDRTKHPVINFGPLSVLPEYQKTGVGSALMRHTLRVADLMGYGAVLFFGHPEYYPRFGFKEAKEFGITTAWGANFPAFMAMELIHGSLSGVTGSFYESPLFNVDNEKAREFDRMIFCRG